MKELRIFYVHGMGGGTDSRIPSVLAEHYSAVRYQNANSQECTVKVLVKTYDFDPEIGGRQIKGWAEEFKPDLVIGESLGSSHAMCIGGVPHLYVSPAMSAPRIISTWAWVAYFPGVTSFLNHFFRPTRPNRQKMDFRPAVMRKYAALYQEACAHARKDFSFAFFGDMDHYRKWGIVEPSQWAKRYGEYEKYPGTHYMEMEFLDTMLIPKINEILEIKEVAAVTRLD